MKLSILAVTISSAVAFAPSATMHSTKSTTILHATGRERGMETSFAPGHFDTIGSFGRLDAGRSQMDGHEARSLHGSFAPGHFQTITTGNAFADTGRKQIDGHEARSLHGSFAPGHFETVQGGGAANTYQGLDRGQRERQYSPSSGAHVSAYGNEFTNVNPPTIVPHSHEGHESTSVNMISAAPGSVAGPAKTFAPGSWKPN